MKIARVLPFVLVITWQIHSLAADTTYIRVHFLYGSKPLRQFRDEEPKWFGGQWGGHAGIEIAEDSVFSFVPSGTPHVFSHRFGKHSHFRYDPSKSFAA